MPQDDNDRPTPMLGSKDERIQKYLRKTLSTDDIVREVTSAFAEDVARIMSNVSSRGTPADQDRQSDESPNRGRRR